MQGWCGGGELLGRRAFSGGRRAAAAMPWLHGTLYATVLEARDLPDDNNLGINVKTSIPGAKSKFGGMLMKGIKTMEEGVGAISFLGAIP